MSRFQHWLRHYLSLYDLKESTGYHSLMLAIQESAENAVKQVRKSELSWVHVLLFARKAEIGDAITAGACRGLPVGKTVVTMHCHIPLTDLMLVVFADMSKVSIASIYFGQDYSHAFPGECPVAYFDRIEAGQVIRVECERRV